MVSKKSKFGIGLVLGALGGALAGLFLAPKSGKQTQSDAKKAIKGLEKDFIDLTKKPKPSSSKKSSKRKKK